MASGGLPPIPATSCSRPTTRPWVGASTPASNAVRVDLPAPLGPMTATHSPARTSAHTSCNASTAMTGRFADITEARGRRVTDTDSAETSTPPEEPTGPAEPPGPAGPAGPAEPPGPPGRVG